ncbi:endonuclease domain-containing 1 protein-like [Mytilus californianus]|uniref:endonuclease domain-containing 1 protein-like n=1 Tax=Mytilus californianus TaxID=6549 RepID=UPI002247411F|nr:endonuclease domain-containing 1 protein-like [Mytilus californianus]
MLLTVTRLKHATIACHLYCHITKKIVSRYWNKEMSFKIFFVFCLYLGVTETKVFKNFNKCRHFFYKGQSPSFLNLSGDIVYICQQYNNKFFYATLYDTKNRIPVYSALELDLRFNGKRLDDKFFIEPMLATNGGGNMIEFDSSKHSTYGKKQALGTDYSNSGYDRGHLNPQMFNTLDDDTRYATNTFTNIAPQYEPFNLGTWQDMEKKLLSTTKAECNFPGARRYVIVGVQPSSNRYIERDIGNQQDVKRVNVPKFYWTAICCDTSTATDTDDREKGWSFAYKADNIYDRAVTVTFDPVDKFLPNQYSKIFADYTSNGKTVVGCQFSRDDAVRIITHIKQTIGGFPIFEPNPTSRF